MGVHPYFVERAARAMSRHGGDPSCAGLLAAWAEAHRDTRETFGVVVAEDGSLLAETVRIGVEPGVVYVCAADSKRWDLFGNEVGLAMAHLRGEVGQRVVHITRTEVCTGPSARALG